MSEEYSYSNPKTVIYLPKCPPATREKLRLHLKEFRKAERLYRRNIDDESTSLNFHHVKKRAKIDNLFKRGYIFSIILNTQIESLQKKKMNLLKKILLKYKRFFLTPDPDLQSYTYERSLFPDKMVRIKEKLFILIKKIIYLCEDFYEDVYYEKIGKHIYRIFLEIEILWINISNAVLPTLLPKLLKLQAIVRPKLVLLYNYIKNITKKITKFTEKLTKKLIKYIVILVNMFNTKFDAFFGFITKNFVFKWHIYLTRFIVVTLIHLVPFIQLMVSTVSNQQNSNFVHPILVHLYNIAPFLVPLVHFFGPIFTEENISFLIIGPYLYFFVYSYKKYKISRKISYQGTFASALMFYNYSLSFLEEAILFGYTVLKRLFLAFKVKNQELLRDDVPFYFEELTDFKFFKEMLIQHGENLFVVDEVTQVAKFCEVFTLLPLLGVIALLYNYVYFIVRGQKPIIPVVTKTVRRMMVDRGGEEYE